MVQPSESQPDSSPSESRRASSSSDFTFRRATSAVVPIVVPAMKAIPSDMGARISPRPNPTATHTTAETQTADQYTNDDKAK